LSYIFSEAHLKANRK